MDTTKTGKAKEKFIRSNQEGQNLLYGREFYIWMLLGFGLIILGMFLMLGGYTTDPNVFSESEIYSFRRITLAPIIIILGLVIEVYAIFKK